MEAVRELHFSPPIQAIVLATTIATTIERSRSDSADCSHAYSITFFLLSYVDSDHVLAKKCIAIAIAIIGHAGSHLHHMKHICAAYPLELHAFHLIASSCTRFEGGTATSHALGRGVFQMLQTSMLRPSVWTTDIHVLHCCLIATGRNIQKWAKSV
jgi:hypothetical protein